MIEALFDKVAALFQKEEPVTAVVDGKTYAIKADRTLGDYVRPPAPLDAPTLNVKTLTGVVAAFNAQIDTFPDEVALQVEDVDSVALVSMRADDFGRRHVWVRAKALPVTPFNFGADYEPEPFLIALQAAFLPSENVSALQQLCSKLKSGSTITVDDDGISQNVTYEEGAVQRSQVQVPARLPLAPYRTFREITPVASDFLVRMKGAKDALPKIRLLEVDGGLWRVQTIAAIGEWLKAQLPAVNVIA